MTQDMRIELTVNIKEYDKIKKMLPHRRILVNGELYLKRREQRLVKEAEVMVVGEEITIEQLKRKIAKQGIKPSWRTLQRDIDSLERRGIIKTQVRIVPNGKGRKTYIEKIISEQDASSAS